MVSNLDFRVSLAGSALFRAELFARTTEYLYLPSVQGGALLITSSNPGIGKSNNCTSLSSALFDSYSKGQSVDYIQRCSE